VEKFHHLAINKGGVIHAKDFLGEKIAQSHHNSRKKSQI
jgi:hypothetical protein